MTVKTGLSGGGWEERVEREEGQAAGFPPPWARGSSQGSAASFTRARLEPSKPASQGPPTGVPLSKKPCPLCPPGPQAQL